MKKIDPHKKMKLIYSGELLLFAVIFLVVAILKLTGVMGYNETRRIVFNWITIFGGLWGITDFVWGAVSKKRRARICLLDKALLLPLVLFIETFDFISLIAKPENESFYVISIGCAFLYITVIYTFQAIYHYFKPIPGLFDDEEEEKKDENSQEKPINSKENAEK